MEAEHTEHRIVHGYFESDLNRISGVLLINQNCQRYAYYLSLC